jgi:hypothetical protein
VIISFQKNCFNQWTKAVDHKLADYLLQDLRSSKYCSDLVADAHIVHLEKAAASKQYAFLLSLFSIAK